MRSFLKKVFREHVELFEVATFSSSIELLGLWFSAYVTFLIDASYSKTVGSLLLFGVCLPWAVGIVSSLMLMASDHKVANQKGTETVHYWD